VYHKTETTGKLYTSEVSHGFAGRLNKPQKDQELFPSVFIVTDDAVQHLSPTNSLKPCNPRLSNDKITMAKAAPYI